MEHKLLYWLPCLLKKIKDKYRCQYNFKFYSYAERSQSNNYESSIKKGYYLQLNKNNDVKFIQCYKLCIWFVNH